MRSCVDVGMILEGGLGFGWLIHTWFKLKLG